MAHRFLHPMSSPSSCILNTGDHIKIMLMVILSLLPAPLMTREFTRMYAKLQNCFDHALLHSNVIQLDEIPKPVSEIELPEGPELDQTTATSGRTSKKSSLRSTESTDISSGKGKPKGIRSQKAISPVPSSLLEEEATR